MIYGVDTASRKLHVVNGQYESCVESTIPSKLDVDPARYVLFVTMQDFAMKTMGRGDVIYCEQPLSLSNGKTSRILALAAGGVYAGAGAAIEAFGVRWEWVDVEAWKRHIVGKGGASKQEIQDHARTFGLDFIEEDSYDAACIAAYGQLCEELGQHPLTIKAFKKLKPDEQAEYETRYVEALRRHEAQGGICPR